MKRPISLLVAYLLLTNLSAQQSQLQEDLQHIVEELKTSNEFGISILPETAEIFDFNLEKGTLYIRLDLSFNFLYQDLNSEILEEITEHFIADLADHQFSDLHLSAKIENGNFRELSDFIVEKPIAVTSNIANNDPSPAIKGPAFKDNYSNVQPKGQLAGNTVWLSAGHGWIYDSRFKAFRTQRHNTHGLVEDFSNIETVNYHLLKYLYNAGANVWTVRERDMNTNEVIVDNDQGAPHYREYGRWATSSTKGRNNKTYRFAISRKKENATAVFTPEIPESGLYWVSVYYQNGYNRSVDTRYRILHAGGESRISINQEVHGNTWVYLGQFYFEKGNEGKVIVSNESSERSQAIIADAVRFGGGIGNQGDCYHRKTSKEPRYEEGARYYAKYQGYPNCEGDISIRPKYAEWELSKGTKEEQKKAIFLSWHSNASGARGTESFVHRYNRRLGSRQLQKAIHHQLIRDIREGYDRSWKNRGQKAADFGELRSLRTMPGVLLEIGFHDNKQDANALSDPAFRNLVARAVYKGITRYFANNNHLDPVFLPEPPTHLSARNQKGGKIKLEWKKPRSGGIYGDAAKAYKVYISQHGKAFAKGIETKTNHFVFDDLQAGTTYYFRVSAINKGGESFPTAVVAARSPVSPDQPVEYLIVDGFDRLDRSLAIIQNEQAPLYAPLGNTRRLYLERMNNYDYASEHASSMAAAGLAFDGATNEAVIARDIELEKYFGINWFLGRESSNDQTLSAQEQYLLKRFLKNGGVLIISGSELAYDLSKSPISSRFYEEYLKAELVHDDANHNRINSFFNNDFRGLDGFLQNNNYGAYPLRSPDIIKPAQGSVPILHYKKGKTAAIAYRGDFAVVNFGFPLESIGDAALRNEIFKKSIHYIDPARKTSFGIAMIPESFSRNLSINLKKATEGEAKFNLYDGLGKAILRKSWKHYGRGQKIFYLSDLPDGEYSYQFEINGQKQDGKIRKESP